MYSIYATTLLVLTCTIYGFSAIPAVDLDLHWMVSNMNQATTEEKQALAKQAATAMQTSQAALDRLFAFELGLR